MPPLPPVPPPLVTGPMVRGLLVMGLRLGVLVAVILGASWLAQAVIAGFDLSLMPQTAVQMQRLMTVGLVVYVVLLALPFVPGAEIGVALLACFGADVAAQVYGATVLGLFLAYGVGRASPPLILARWLRRLSLTRAADLLVRAAPLTQQARLTMLMAGAPRRSLTLALRHRYLALMLAVNTPGNVVIGGGGGIMMMAGLSGLFAPVPTLLAIALAVLPVPALVWFFGA
jgi:hypothetical protein